MDIELLKLSIADSGILTALDQYKQQQCLEKCIQYEQESKQGVYKSRKQKWNPVRDAIQAYERSIDQDVKVQQQIQHRIQRSMLDLSFLQQQFDFYFQQQQYIQYTRFKITKQLYFSESFILDLYNFNNTNIRNLNKYIEPCYDINIKFDSNNIFYYSNSEDLYQYTYCIVKNEPEQSIYLTNIQDSEEENQSGGFQQFQNNINRVYDMQKQMQNLELEIHFDVDPGHTNKLEYDLMISSNIQLQPNSCKKEIEDLFDDFFVQL